MTEEVTNVKNFILTCVAGYTHCCLGMFTSSAEEKERLATSGSQNISPLSGSPLSPFGGRTHAVSAPHRTGITSMGAVPNISGGGAWANFVTINRTKKKSSKKEKKQKIRKEDISNPTNFQSVFLNVLPNFVFYFHRFKGIGLKFGLFSPVILIPKPHLGCIISTITVVDGFFILKRWARDSLATLPDVTVHKN